MVDKLSKTEWEHIYKTRVMKDFPPEERRPLSNTKRLHRQGRYEWLCLRQDGNVLAYAGFLKDESVSCVLMDYFAVEPSRRGTGVGSRFLRELNDYFDMDGIALEVELPELAKTAEDRETRRRRIAFYVKSGAQVSNVGWRVFRARYRLLWLPKTRQLDEEKLAEDVRKLYAVSLPAFLAERETGSFELQPWEGEMK